MQLGLGRLLVDLGGFGVALVKRSNPAADAGEVGLQPAFQVTEHAQRIEVHFLAGGVRALFRLLDQLQGMRLGLLHDFFVANHLFGLLLRLLNDALGLHVGRLRNLVALAHDPTRLANFLGNTNAHLIHNGQQRTLVNDDLVRHRHALRMAQQRLKSLNQVYEIDGDLPPLRVSGELGADRGRDVGRDERLDRTAERPDLTNER